MTDNMKNIINMLTTEQTCEMILNHLDYGDLSRLQNATRYHICQKREKVRKELKEKLEKIKSDIKYYNLQVDHDALDNLISSMDNQY